MLLKSIFFFNYFIHLHKLLWVNLFMNSEKISGIIADADHGGSDPGAVSGGLEEKNFNLQAALYM